MTTKNEMPMGAPASVQVMDGRDQETVAIGRTPFVIGRAEECDLTLPQKYVSRRHAEINFDGRRYSVADAESRHGVFVNGERVTRRMLRARDVIQFGSVEGPQVRFLSAAEEDSSESAILTQLSELSAGKTDLERLRWFLEAARKLNSAGQVEAVLANLLQATLALARMERGFVFLASGAEGNLRCAVGMDEHGLHVSDASVSKTVLRQAEETRERYILTDTLQAEGRLLPHSVLAQNVRSILCLPLRQTSAKGAHAALLGVLYLDSRYEPERLSELDHELLESIAREAAALVENARLARVEEDARSHQKELRIAAGIQQGLMVTHLPECEFAGVQALNLPCSEVGGDFFDVVPSEDALNVALVDVSGKGVSAAILAATLQGMLFPLLQMGTPLREIAAMMNRYLCAKNVGKYATMVLARLHRDGRLQYVNCGHVQPRVCVGGEVRRLLAGNLPVGLLAKTSYSEGCAQMQPGDRLTLVSDGVTEAESADGEAFGETRLDAAAGCVGVPELAERVRVFRGPVALADDCTMIEVGFLGAV